MREAHATAFPTSRSCSATNALELLSHVREIPHDQHVGISEALAVVVGAENATRLLAYMISQDSIILPTLRALHIILREEPSEIITLIGSRATAVLTAALELSGTMIDEQLLAYKRIASADDSIGYVCDKYTTLLRDAGWKSAVASSAGKGYTSMWEVLSAARAGIQDTWSHRVDGEWLNAFPVGKAGINLRPGQASVCRAQAAAKCAGIYG